MIRIRKSKSVMLEELNIAKKIVKSRVPKGNTLIVVFADGSKVVRYHNTTIIEVDPTGNTTLRTGGCFTNTTKERINEFIDLPLSIYQKDHLWFISGKEGAIYDFYDGMVFDKECNLITEDKTTDKVKAKLIRKLINKFAKSIMDLDKLPLPNAGDCWFCLMRNKEGQTLGDSCKDHNHLISHIKQNYMMGSLIANAMLSNGFRKDQIGLHFHMNWRDPMVRSLRKYLHKKLLLPPIINNWNTTWNREDI